MPSPKPARTAPTTSLNLAARIIAIPNASESIECPSCSGPLNLLQPDENDPGRLLGTCESCAVWLLMVELEPDWRKVIVIELPDAEALVRGVPELGHQAEEPADVRGEKSSGRQ